MITVVISLLETLKTSKSMAAHPSGRPCFRSVWLLRSGSGLGSVDLKQLRTDAPDIALEALGRKGFRQWTARKQLRCA